MNISQIITGIALIGLGLFLIGLSFFTDARWIALGYGIASFVIGGFILFNTKEDKIEQIKKLKRG